MPDMPQADRVQGLWQLSVRSRSGEMYVLRFDEFYKDDPSDVRFMTQDVNGKEVRLFSKFEYDSLGGGFDFLARVRTPVEDEILTDLLTRWRALSLIAAF